MGFALKTKLVLPIARPQAKCDCGSCPLNEEKGLRHPKMLPTGSVQPIILMLGDMPTKRDDDKGEVFSGRAGEILRERIPEDWKDSLRWTSSLNCKPSSNKAEEIEWKSCYPRLEQDVIKHKPEAIFGFGYVPLMQVLKPESKYSKMAVMRGRRFPVNIGGHVCWYYPMLHPNDVLHKRKYEPRSLDAYGSDDEFAFVLDLQKAFDEQASPSEPMIHTKEQASADVELLTDIEEIDRRLKLSKKDPSVGVDIETNALRPYTKDAKILSIAFSGKSGTYSFAIEHSQAKWNQEEKDIIDELLRDFFLTAECRLIVHSLAFELEWFGYFYGTDVFYAVRWEDSMSQAYILDARQGGLSLDFLCLQYFGLNLKAISGLDRKNLDAAPLDEVLKYNGIDARYHRLLYLAQVKKIKQEGLQEVYEHQMRRIPSLVLAQLHGVPVDQKVVSKLKDKYEGKALEAAAAIKEEPIVQEYMKKKKKDFNPSSPIAVLNILRDNGVKVETTAKGELAHVDHPIARKIVKWREANKIKSTYIDPLCEGAETIFPDGMLHPIFSTTTVVSWRTSSNSINIQNIPHRDAETKEVRAQIKSPDPDMQVVSFDYAGIQARNVAMESKDKKLVDAFWHDYDIHRSWMERINKKYPKWIPKSKLQDKDSMKHYRYLAKNKFVFPAFFGAQSYTMSEGLGIPEDKCEELREEFFEEFSGIKKWHSKLNKHYYKHGYITGLSGFICRAPISSNQRINLPIQGDEAYIVLDAMARLSEMEDPRYQPMLEIHDDISFLWPKKEVEKRAEIVIRTMIDVPFEWAKIVPIEVEMSVGSDWLNQEEAGKYASNKWNGIVQAA